MGLDNNLWGLILPYLTFSLPTCVYIMTGFFRSIPNELLESACIDGCSIYKTFYSICLPLSKTGLFVTGLMTFIGNWNELLLAMVFIHDDTKKTLPVAVTKFVSPYQTNYEKMFPAILIAIIPSIIVYSMFSNQIVDGLTQDGRMTPVRFFQYLELPSRIRLRRESRCSEGRHPSSAWKARRKVRMLV